MTHEQFKAFMSVRFDVDIQMLAQAGQDEYAQSREDAFANFKRTAKELHGVNEKDVLWVFAMKHKDGISSYLKGNVSQREDVTGRIADLIVYLFLLWGMIEEEKRENEDA